MQMCATTWKEKEHGIVFENHPKSIILYNIAPTLVKYLRLLSIWGLTYLPMILE